MLLMYQKRGVSVTEMRQRKEKESKVNIQQQQHACGAERRTAEFG